MSPRVAGLLLSAMAAGLFALGLWSLDWFPFAGGVLAAAFAALALTEPRR